MIRQRGSISIEGIAWLIGIAAVLGALYGLWHAIDSRAEQRGRLAVMADWNEANNKATREQRAREKVATTTGREQAALLSGAQGAAQRFEELWRQEREKSRRNNTPLAAIDCPPVGAPADARPRLRLTWEFVRLHDTAWTGADGKPLFGDSGVPTETAGAAGAASPYGLDELTDNQGENAKRYSACIRDFNALIDTVIKLRQGWK